MFIYQHDEYLNHNDELYEWEIHNQHEIEMQIVNADQDDAKQQYILDATPIDFQTSIVREMSDIDTNDENDSDHVDYNKDRTKARISVNHRFSDNDNENLVFYEQI